MSVTIATPSKTALKSFLSDLKRVKKELALPSNAALADLLDLSRHTLGRWLSGASKPTVAQIENVYLGMRILARKWEDSAEALHERAELIYDLLPRLPEMETF